MLGKEYWQIIYGHADSLLIGIETHKRELFFSCPLICTTEELRTSTLRADCL